MMTKKNSPEGEMYTPEGEKQMERFSYYKYTILLRKYNGKMGF